MKKQYQNCKAEVLKLKGNWVFPIHFISALVFGISFALYFSMRSNSNLEVKLRYFSSALGIVLPLMSILIITIVVATEKVAGNFYNILSSPTPAIKFLLRKIGLLLTLNLITLLFTNFFFFVIVEGSVPLKWITAITIYLWLSNIWVYFVGFAITLSFGTTISLILGGFSVVISMLFLTGMGDNIWKYTPFSWSSRGASYLVYSFFGKNTSETFTRTISIIIAISIVLFLCSVLYFKWWEGSRKIHD